MDRKTLLSLKYFNYFLYSAQAFLTPFLPLYFQREGFHSEQISILLSLGAFVSLFANPFWGFWSDRLQNTRFVLSALLIGSFLFSQVFFELHAFIFVFIMMVSFYFFQSPLNTTSNSLILHAVEDTPYEFGLFRAWGSLGFAFTGLFSGLLIDVIGIHHLGYIYGGFLLLPLGLSFFLPQQGKKTASNTITVIDFMNILKNRYFLIFLLSTLFLAIPYRLNNIFISLYMHDMGGSNVYIGWSWFIAAIGEYPIFLFLDRHLNKSKPSMMRIIAFISLLFAIRWGLMGLAHNAVQVVLIQSLQSFTFGIFFYTATHFVSSLVPTSYRASGQALFTLTWLSISGIIVGVSGGILYDSLGPHTLYFIGALLSIIGMIGMAFLWFLLQKNREHLSD